MEKYGVISTTNGLQTMPYYEAIVNNNVWFSGSKAECDAYIQSVHKHTGSNS